MNLANPMTRHLRKNNRHISTRKATLNDVLYRVAYFAILVAGGAVFALYNPFVIYEKHIMIGSMIFVLLSTILTLISQRLTPIIGSINSLAHGAMLATLSIYYSDLYNGIVPIAICLTVFSFFLVLTLYLSDIVKVGNKIKAITKCLFYSGLLITALVLSSSLFTNSLINLFYKHNPVTLLSAGILLVVSIISIVYQLEIMATKISLGVDKKSVWNSAFLLNISLIWTYFWVLTLLKRVIPINSEK